MSMRERARIYSQELADERNKELDEELKYLNPHYKASITNREVSVEDTLPQAPSIYEIELV